MSFENPTQDPIEGLKKLSIEGYKVAMENLINAISKAKENLESNDTMAISSNLSQIKWNAERLINSYKEQEPKLKFEGQDSIISFCNSVLDQISQAENAVDNNDNEKLKSSLKLLRGNIDAMNLLMEGK